MKLILASTSESRKKILSRIGMPFLSIDPICDETPKHDENPIELVERLSETKAMSVAQSHPNDIVIGSDQVGVLNGKIIGKPHTAELAKQQLLESSGKSVSFYTGLSVINLINHYKITIYEQFTVTFRTLSELEIETYIRKENPLHCAGSFKCDGLGIMLFSKLQGEDINALIGLPLIRLNKILIDIGQNPLLC